MKTINETFTEREYRLLIEKKNGKSWRNFILTLIDDDENNVEGDNIENDQKEGEEKWT